MADATIKPLELELVLKVQKFVETLRTIAGQVKATDVTPGVDTAKVQQSGDALNKLADDLEALGKTPAGPELEHVGDAAEHSGEKAEHAHGMWAKLKEGFTEGLGIGTAILGLQNLEESVHEAFDAFEEKEKAVRGVELAMSDLGEEGEKASKDMVEWAHARQAVTEFSDTATLKVIQFGKQFGKINDPAKLKEFTLAMQNYAAATGKDLETASQTLSAKLEAGGKDKTLGIKFDPGDTEANMQKFIEASNRKFKGFAENIANDGAGAIAKFKNQFGDILEKIGAIFSTLLQPFLPILSTTVHEIGNFLDLINQAPGPLRLVSIAVLGIVAAMTVYNIASQASIVTKTKEMVVDGLLKTGKMLGVVAQNEETGALILGATAHGVLTFAKNLLNGTLIKSAALWVLEKTQLAAGTIATTTVAGATGALTLAKNLLSLSTLKNVGSWIAENAVKVVATGVTIAQTAATWALNAAMIVLTSPITYVVIAIAALVGGLIYAYNHSEAFRNILGALWEAIKVGIGFFLKWLNPIGLLVQGFKLLYEKVGFFKDAVDSIVNVATGAWDALKKFVGVTDESSESLEKNKTAAEAAADAQAKLKQAVEEAINAFDNEKNRLSTNVDYLTNQATVARDRARELQEYLNRTDISADQRKTAEDRLRFANEQLGIEQSVGRERKANLVTMEREATLSKEAVEASDPKRRFDEIKAKADEFDKTYGAKGISFAAAKGQIAALRAQFLATHKELTLDEKSMIRDMESAMVDFQKKHEDLIKVGRSAAATQYSKQLADIDANLKEQIKMLGKARAEGVMTEEEYNVKSAALTKKADADKLAARREFLAKLHIAETNELDTKIADVAKNNLAERDQLKAALDDKIITQGEYDKALVNLEIRSGHERLQATVDFLEKQHKEREDSAAQQLTADLSKAQIYARAMGTTVAAMQERITRVYAEQQRERNDALEAKEIEAATTNISNEEQRAAEIKKIHEHFDALRVNDAQKLHDDLAKIQTAEIDRELEIEKQKAEISLRARGRQEEDLQFKLDVMDAEYSAEIQKLAVTAKSQEEFEQAKTAATTKYSRDRQKMVTDEIKQENVAYLVANTAIQKAFEKLSSALKTAIAKLLGWEKEQKEEATANDLHLKQIEHDKSLQSLQEQVKESKISYEEYLARKQKLDDDYQKAKDGKDKQSADNEKSIAQEITETIIDELAKRAEAWVADQIARFVFSLTQQATTTAAVVAAASVAATAWAPAAAMASVATLGAADAAGAAGLAGTVAAAQVMAHIPGAAEGLVHRPGADGAKGQLIAIGESGKEEFATPRETAEDYFKNDFGPKLLEQMVEPGSPMIEKHAVLQQLYHNTMNGDTAFARGYQKVVNRGGFMPRVSPTLQMPSAMRSQQLADLYGSHSKFSSAVDRLVDEGIEVRTHQRGDDIIGATRTANRRVARRAYTTGGGQR